MSGAGDCQVLLRDARADACDAVDVFRERIRAVGNLFREQLSKVVAVAAKQVVLVASPSSVVASLVLSLLP